MESEEIKRLLANAWISQADIARQLNVRRNTVCQVIKGERKSFRIQQAIAEAVGKTVEELWGENAVPQNSETSNVPIETGSGEFSDKNDLDILTVSIPLSYFVYDAKYEGYPWRKLYYRANLNQLRFPVVTVYEGKRKRLYLEVDDPRIINKYIFKAKLKKMEKELSKRGNFLKEIKVIIPKNRAVEIIFNNISTPGIGHYHTFYEFVEREHSDLVLSKMSGGKKRKIRVFEDDYNKLLKVAKDYGVSVGRMWGILADAYFKYRLSFGLKEVKGATES